MLSRFRTWRLLLAVCLITGAVGSGNLMTAAKSAADGCDTVPTGVDTTDHWLHFEVPGAFTGNSHRNPAWPLAGPCMIWAMSETPERPSETTGPVSQPAAAPTPLPPPPPQYKQSRLNQVAAWVGIVAGVVFIVAVIFGTGFMVGKHSGGPRFDHHRELALFHRGGPPMFPMGPRGQFERQGPGIVFPDGPGYAPDPTTSAPTAPTPTRP